MVFIGTPPRSGLNNTAEYMTSGLPFTFTGTTGGAPIRIDFPFVTNFICVNNLDTAVALKVGFTENGILGTNYFSVFPSSEVSSTPLYLRVKTLYIDADSAVEFEVVAGLTMIKAKEMPTLTGSAVQGISGSFPEYIHELGYEGIG
jgi:hypothetical protein